MKNYVQPGNAIRLIAPTGGVIAGRPYAIGGIVGIASETKIAGGSFELARDGVYSVDKDASEFAAGDAVYALAGAATSDDTGGFLGYATGAAGTGDETVDVLLVTGKSTAGSTPVAAYTEISFTWYAVGESAPVITSRNSSPDIAITPTAEGDGVYTFAFPANTFPDVDKVEVLYSPMSDIGAGVLRLLSVSGISSNRFFWFQIRNTSFVGVDSVGSISNPVTTVIRIFP